MCEPTSLALAGVGLNVAGGALDFFGQQDAVKQQNRFNQQQFETNKELAERAAGRQRKALTQNRLQEQEAEAAELAKITEEALKSTGLARVAAGASGAAGAAVSNLVSDFASQEIKFRDTVTRNAAFADLAFQNEFEAIEAQLQGRVLSATPTPIPKPSFLGAALRIGTGAFTQAQNSGLF